MKNKKEVLNYEKNKLLYTRIVLKKLILLNTEWNVYYHIFLIHEPKSRIIMSLKICDKVLNHYVARNILIKKLEKRLDFRNVATRKNMGTRLGRKLLIKYILSMKKPFYFLKLDIKGYFYHINHEVLLGLIKPFITKEELIIIKNILASTNQPYINETIKRLRKTERYEI